MRTVRRRLGRSFAEHSQDGFTMVELLMAMVILLVVAGFVSAGLVNVAGINRNNRNRVAAAALVEAQLEQVRSTDTSSLALGLQTLPASSVNGTTFTLQQSIVPKALGTGASACDSGAAGGSTLTIYLVTVTATWDKMNGVKPVQSDTQIVPPSTVGANPSYNIGVKVVAADNNPLPSHTIMLNPGGRSAVTDAQGCAFFGGLATGSYTAELNDPGWVDQQLSQDTTVTIGTPSNGVTAVGSMVYDRAGALQLLLPGDVTHRVPANMPVTVSSSSLRPSPQLPVAGTGDLRVIPGLFPFTSGYQAWIGDCIGADARPSGPFAVSPGGGGLPAASVQTGRPLDIQVVGKDGRPTSGAPVSLTQGKSSGSYASTGCPTAETYNLGNADLNGYVHVWMPYGTWTVVAGTGPKGGSVSVTLDASSSAAVSTQVATR